MSLNRLVSNQWFSRIVLAVWVTSAVLAMFLLTRIDLIVNGQLYSYNLQFAPAWADPYWNYTHLIYVGLGIPMTLSFTRKIDQTPLNVTKEPKSVQQVVRQERKAKVKKNTGVNLGSCPSCQKVFSKPIVMLNFDRGKTKLVNICPYCNQVLDGVQNEKSPENEVQIAELDKKLTH